MEERSRRRVRNLVTRMAATGLSAHETGCADTHHGPEHEKDRTDDGRRVHLRFAQGQIFASEQRRSTSTGPGQRAFKARWAPAGNAL